MVRACAPLILCSLILTTGLSRSQATDEPFVEKDQIGNAALVYWQAFAVLPTVPDSGFGLDFNSEDAQYVVPPEDRELLEACQAAMNLAELIGPETPCRWEIVADGPQTLMPHLSKARLLARVLLSQALVDAEAQNFDRAIDRVIASMILARNVDEGSLINLLVAQAIETLSCSTAKTFVDDLSDESKKRLAGAVAQLPPRATLASTMRYEKELFFGWVANVILQEKEEAIAALKPLMGGEQLDASLLELLGQDAASKQEVIDEYSETFDRLIAAVQPEVIDQDALDVMEEEINISKNPIIKSLIPGISRISRNYAENRQQLDTFWASLSTAR